jgi:uncharacterized protein (DUF58 family)
MEGNMTGFHKSPHRGSSVEFAEYRKYAPGDDIRHVDWRVYARTDRFYMKEFEADTNLRCYLVLDCSGSMGFAMRHEDKFSYARKAIATLAYLLVQQGDAVGLLCFNDKHLKDIPPRRNPAHLRNIFDALAEVKPHGPTAVVRILHTLAEKIHRRALVIVFSDFFAELDSLLDCFQHLCFRKHDVALFHLLDRAEIEFQFDRPVRFVDMECSDRIVAEPSMIRAQYQQELQRYLERIETGSREFGVDYRRVMTDQDYEKVLANFLVERTRIQ